MLTNSTPDVNRAVQKILSFFLQRTTDQAQHSCQGESSTVNAISSRIIFHNFPRGTGENMKSMIGLNIIMDTGEYGSFKWRLLQRSDTSQHVTFGCLRAIKFQD